MDIDQKKLMIPAAKYMIMARACIV